MLSMMAYVAAHWLETVPALFVWFRWFHDVPFRADEWSLLELESPRASGARALSFGRLYTRDGIQAVSCAQEGLIRLKS